MTKSIVGYEINGKLRCPWWVTTSKVCYDVNGKCMFDVKVFNSKFWLTWTFAWDIYDMIVSVVFLVYDINGRFVIKIYYIHHEFVLDIYDIKMNFLSTSTTEMVILRHNALCSILNTHLYIELGIQYKFGYFRLQ